MTRIEELESDQSRRRAVESICSEVGVQTEEGPLLPLSSGAVSNDEDSAMEIVALIDVSLFMCLRLMLHLSGCLVHPFFLYPVHSTWS